MIRPLLLAGFGTALTVAPAFAAAPVSRSANAKDCIDVSRIGHETAESRGVLVFHMIDGKAYRNRLIAACPGLMNTNGFWRLEMEPSGSQLCRGDRVRPFDPRSVRTMGMHAYPACGLGVFEPAPDLAHHHGGK